MTYQQQLANNKYAMLALNMGLSGIAAWKVASILSIFKEPDQQLVSNLGKIYG